MKIRELNRYLDDHPAMFTLMRPINYRQRICYVNGFGIEQGDLIRFVDSGEACIVMKAEQTKLWLKRAVGIVPSGDHRNGTDVYRVGPTNLVKG